MHEQVKGAAWALGMWGVLSVVFGALILAWPGITLKAFLVALGVYFLASGVVLAVGSLVNRSGNWAGGALIGALSAVAGLYVFAHPGISALAVLTVIALWSIAVGVLQIVAGFESGKQGWWLTLSGAIYTLFGLYVFANPKGGAIAVIWLIGLSVIASGLVLTVAAFKVGELNKQLAKST